MHLLTSTVTVTSPTHTTTTDPAGVLTSTDTTRRWRGHLQQSRTREETGNQAVALSDWNLYLEPAAACSLDDLDQVTVDGVAYEVDGTPWAARNPRTGVVTHVECRVRRSH